MFIQIFPACVIIHTLSSFPPFAILLSFSFPLFPFPFLIFGEKQTPSTSTNPNPLPHARNHTLFFFLSGDIYLFLPCLLPAHSSQSLSPDISSHSLSSFTPRLLSNFPALSPIHLPLCVPASLDHDIAHSLPLSTSILSSPYTTSILPLLPPLHSFTLKSEQISEPNSRRCKYAPAYISPFRAIHTLSICTPSYSYMEPHGFKLDKQLKEMMALFIKAIMNSTASRIASNMCLAKCLQEEFRFK